MRAPRALANSSSSRTRQAAASLNTKPSRSLSNGREALCGSSFRRDRACIALNAPIATLMTPASLPPASITSAWPRRIVSAASPIACALDAQADTVARFGPFGPYFIATSPAAMSMIIIGIMNGETFRGSLSCEMMLSTSVSTPPMPDPKVTPIFGALSFVMSSFASLIAWPAVAIANCANRSARFASLRSMYARGSKSWTSPAIRVSRSFASNRVIGPMPLLPAVRPAQDVSTVAPSGVIIPRPVTTTRRRSPFMWSSLSSQCCALRSLVTAASSSLA